MASRVEEQVVKLCHQLRGVSLIEALLALSILTLLIALSLGFAREPSGSARGLAEWIGAESQRLREKARSSGVPQGLALAAGGGGFATNTYLLEGFERARVTRTQRLNSEFPGACLLAAHWDLAAGDPPVLNFDGFSVTDWLGPGFTDPALIFLPNGIVMSNMPSFDSRFTLICAERFRVTPGAVGGSPYFELQAVSRPAMVEVFAGGLNRSTQVAAIPVPDADGEPTQVGPAAPAPANPTLDPTISNLEIFPEQPDLEPGLDALVFPHGSLTLEVTASDSQGESLICRWIADGGRFSHPDGEMEWDTRRQTWVGATTWYPDPGAPAGTRYRVDCQVRDESGQMATRPVGISGVFEVTTEERFLFSIGNVGIGSVTTEGADFKLETPGNNLEAITSSPNGSSVIYVENDYRLMSLDEGDPEPRQILDGSLYGFDYLYDNRVSPDGTQILFLGETGTTCDVYLIGIDGNHPHTGVPGFQRLTNFNWRIANPGWGGRGAGWHPNSQVALVPGGDELVGWGGRSVMEIVMGPTPIVREILNDGVAYAELDISFGGDVMVERDAQLDQIIYTYLPGDATTPGTLTMDSEVTTGYPDGIVDPRFSSDGQSITFRNIRPGPFAICRVDKNDPTNVDVIFADPGQACAHPAPILRRRGL